VAYIANLLIVETHILVHTLRTFHAARAL